MVSLRLHGNNRFETEEEVQAREILEEAKKELKKAERKHTTAKNKADKAFRQGTTLQRTAMQWDRTRPDGARPVKVLE